jgi:hypothetical protein
MKYEAIEGYPPYDPNASYSMLGYPAAMVERALNNDDVAALQKMLDYGWIEKTSITLIGHTMLEYCRLRKATKCAALFAQ